MPFVVTEICVRCKYTDCVEVCPQQAFREGPNFVAIDPRACANCGLREMVCPVDAIKADYALPLDQTHARELNARLALVWPMAQSRKPLTDADHWATVSNKWAWLETGSQG
jgi:ferredoxin